jgi:hypothetical protein
MDLHEDRHRHTAWLMNFMTERVTGDVCIYTSLSFPRSELNYAVANAHCALCTRVAKELIEMQKASVHHQLISNAMHTGIYRVLLTIMFAVQLVACGGGGGGGAGGSADVASDVRIGGSVGDGLVTGATIVVYADNGDELGSMTSNSNASFQSTVSARKHDYPLLIKSTGGFDLVTGAEPEFEMLSVMLSRTDSQQNINPFTTLIVKTAQYLPGGLNSKNIKTARNTVMNRLGFGLDPNLVPDPITTTIDASYAANIIKASEVLAEMLRRTSRTVSATGTRFIAEGV